WVSDEDYKRAGFKLLPSGGGQDMNTAIQIMIYTLFLLPLGLLPSYFGLTGLNSGIVATVCGALFLAQTFSLMRDCSRKSALKIMFGSFLYLPSVQIAYLLDKLPEAMERELKYVDIEDQPIAMHPKKFALWLFMVTVVMVFAGLTSAYIVRQSEGNWLEYDLPGIFWVTSGIAVLSSLTLQWAYYSARKDNFANLKIGMALTVLLGIGFLVGQWYSWVAMVDREVFFVGNPSGSFLY